MKTPRSSLLVMAVVASFLAHQAFGARAGGGGHAAGGGGHAAGGGGARPSGGAAHYGGGAARQSFGHAPTFSSPHVNSAPAFRAAPHNDFARPNVGTRPNIETRPNVGTRPNLDRPNLENRPEFAHRSPVEGRPDVVGRPGFENRVPNHQDFFGRPGIADHPGLGVRPSLVNHPEYLNRPGIDNRAGLVADRGNFDRNRIAGSWYHGDWHDHWGNGNHWYGRPTWWWGNNWWGAGYLPGYAAWQIPWSWGYWGYSNPYYTQPLSFGSTTVDYSQPIVMAQPPATVAQDPIQGGGGDQSAQFLDSARDAFMHGEYQQALTQVDRAIGLTPNDSVLHEFRGLVLFALGDYHQAAASVYAALSVGPGWDWTTLSSLYPDTETYTQQLRALEQYANQNPNQSDARFLLAYHYLTCGYTDQAVGQLQEVVQLNPKDQLSAQLLASLTNPQSAAAGANPNAAPGIPPAPPAIGGSTEPVAPAAPPAAPVIAADLAGRWTATRPDGSTIVLNLGNDSKYDWNYTNNGQAHNFAGTFSLADNLLILKQGDTPTMVGQVNMVNNRQFNFKMPGDNPNDPGLTFTRG